MSVTPRPRLREILAQAWHAAFAIAYAHRRINSERGLQVYFCAELFRLFTESKIKRAVFVEPRLKFSDGKRCYPDLVICDRDKIVAIVELKYRPNGRPSPDKDFATLMRLCVRGARVALANDRYRGPAKEKSYVVADNTIACWANCSSNAIALPPRSVTSLGERLLHLQALTHHDSTPTILPPLRDA